MGALVAPSDYLEIRQDMHEDLLAAENVWRQEYRKYFQTVRNREETNNLSKGFTILDDGITEYYGPKNPQTIIVTMGSVAGTIKEALKELGATARVGLLKIKLYRPFPATAVSKILDKAATVIVLDKAISLGYCGPLFADVKTAGTSAFAKKNLQNWIAGLGGRDISVAAVKKIIAASKRRKNNAVYFS